MIRMQLELALSYQVAAPGADFIFNLHAAQTPRQRIVVEQFEVNQAIRPEVFDEPVTGNRYARLHAAPGPLSIHYRATIELNHYMVDPQSVGEVPVARLPVSALHYLYPSRYCQSDRLSKLAIREFGGLWQGYSRVQAIQSWVRDHVSFVSNTSNSSTSAVDTLIEQVGVCRDFAHLMIALCRALSIPARFVTGTDYGADPALGPPDFHAYVEVYLSDRWYLFDPSGTAIPMGLVRFGTGRDAADVAFATIFGSVTSMAPHILMRAITDNSSSFVMPQPSLQALSTDEPLVTPMRGNHNTA